MQQKKYKAETCLRWIKKSSIKIAPYRFEEFAGLYCDEPTRLKYGLKWFKIDYNEHRKEAIQKIVKLYKITNYFQLKRLLGRHIDRALARIDPELHKQLKEGTERVRPIKSYDIAYYKFVLIMEEMKENPELVSELPMLCRKYGLYRHKFHYYIKKYTGYNIGDLKENPELLQEIDVEKLREKVSHVYQHKRFM